MIITSRRSGFTLLELIVVTAIIGTMFALLLPAVQKARSASGRYGCANNMRKIGLMLHQYVTAHRSFPSGVNNPDEKPLPPPSGPFGYHPWWSWMALSTEFYEKPSVFQIANNHAMNVSWWPWGSPSNDANANPIFKVPLGIWICPADDPARYVKSDFGLTAAYTAYLGVSGIKDDDSKAGPPPAPQGAPQGVLALLSKIKLSDITDGTSNTVIVGERPPSNDHLVGWWFAGAGFPGPNVYYYTGKSGGSGWSSFTQKATGDVFLGAREESFWNWLKKQPDAANDSSCVGLAKTGLQPGALRGFCDQAHFWSLHPGGANFLLASGGVRFLTYRQDAILPALCTRAGRD